MNTLGEGQPDVHSEYTNNEFLVTRGLPCARYRRESRYILERVAAESKPFGTAVEVKGETAEIKLKSAN